MTTIRKRANWLAALALCAGASACGSNSGVDGTAPEMSASVALALQVPGGITLDRIQYTISKGAEFTQSGVIDVADSNTISAFIGGIPEGAGYYISLTANDVSNPATSCDGGAEFEVSAYPNPTTSVDVTLLCRPRPRNSSVRVNGSVDICPTVDAFSVNPAEVRVGGTVQLGVVASDLDDPLEDLQYQWQIYRAPGPPTIGTGTIEGGDTSQATVTCTSPGTLYLMVVVRDHECTTTVLGYATCSPAEP